MWAWESLPEQLVVERKYQCMVDKIAYILYPRLEMSATQTNLSAAKLLYSREIVLVCEFLMGAYMGAKNLWTTQFSKHSAEVQKTPIAPSFLASAVP